MWMISNENQTVLFGAYPRNVMHEGLDCFPKSLDLEGFVVVEGVIFKVENTPSTFKAKEKNTNDIFS